MFMWQNPPHEHLPKHARKRTQIRTQVAQTHTHTHTHDIHRTSHSDTLHSETCGARRNFWLPPSDVQFAKVSLLLFLSAKRWRHVLPRFQRVRQIGEAIRTARLLTRTCQAGKKWCIACIFRYLYRRINVLSFCRLVGEKRGENVVLVFN